MAAVCVIGGGIVGTATAYHLARDGVDTRLLDRADDGRATDAGAGILSPATSSRTGSDPWFEFAVDAVDYYPELVDRLREEQDGDTGYAECGLLSVALNDAEVEAFETSLDRIRRRQERLGAPEPGTVEEITPERARELCPPLGDVERAMHYTDAARVDGRTITTAMRRAGKAHGLAVDRLTAEGLTIEDGEVTGVETAEGWQAADTVVIAGGAWSADFEDQLGVSIPVSPMRGQIAHLDVHGETEDTDKWPIVAGFREHYMVPWPDDHIAVGATREAESGFAPRTTATGVHEVLDEALRVTPGVADAELREVRVGLRPVSADHLPVLGDVPGVEDVYLATGHGATGLQLGPYSGKLIADLAQGATPEADISAFDVRRFQESEGDRP